MTAFVVPGDKHFDCCPGGSVNATLDTYTVNAARLTIDTDTRYCASRIGTTGSGANGSLDTLTISPALGGELYVDGTLVKLIPYTNGANTAPNQFLGLAITTATWAGGTVTIVKNGHGLGGNGTTCWVRVGGMEPNAYNGLFLVTIVDVNTFTYALAADPGISTVTNGHFAKYWRCTQTQAKTPTGLSWTGGTATVACTAHGFVSGNSVVVAGVTPAGYNGTFTIAVTGADAFTYAVADPGGASSIHGTATKTVTSFWLGFWSAFNAAPIPTGTTGTAAIPVSGYVKVKNVTNGPFMPGALTIEGGTPPTCNAIGSEFTGWMEIIGAETALGTIPRLGKFTVVGDWFYPLLLPQVSTSITRSGGTTATLNTAGAHGATVGSIITVNNAVPAAYNGTFAIASVPSGTQLTYTMLSDPGGDASTQGNFTVQVCTSGVANQTVQLPASTATTYYAGCQIETAVGSEVYEDYPAMGNLAVAGAINTDASIGKVCWIGTQGLLRLGHDGTQANGYVPTSGRKIRVPNINFINAARAATPGSGTNAVPNATLATRWEFATTGGGQIDLSKANLQWFCTFVQPYSVRLQNVFIHEQLFVQEIASPVDWDNVVVGQTAAQANTALSQTLCYAGGTENNCTWTRAGAQGTGTYVALRTDVTGLTITNEQVKSILFRAHATTGVYTMTRVSNCTWNTFKAVGGRTLATTCSNLTFTTVSYADRIDTTVTGSTYPHYAFDLATACSTIKINGLDFFGLTDRNPYNGLVNCPAGSGNNIKLWNVGTPGAPLSMGSATMGCAYLLGSAAGSASQGIELKRVYTTAPRTGILLGVDNSLNGLILESVWADTDGATPDRLTVVALNMQVRGCKAQPIQVAQTGIYGSHFQDYFYSTTRGEVIISCNEKTTVQPSVSSYVFDQASAVMGFNSVGVLQMPVTADQVTWTHQQKIIGHTAFRGALPAVIVPATGLANLTVSAATWSGGVTTLTTGTHKLQVGDTVVVAASVPASYNGAYVVTEIVSTTQFRYYQAVDPGTWTSGSTVQVQHLAVTAGSWAGGYTSLTTTAHGLKAGDTITVVGTNPAAYDGTFVITNVVSTTQVRYAQSNPGSWTSGGTVRTGPVKIDLQFDIDQGSGFSGVFKNLRKCKTGCTIASAGDGVLAMADTSGLAVGDYAYGFGVGIGGKIQSIDPNVSVTLDVNNIATTATPVTVYFNALPGVTVADAAVGFALKVRAIANVNFQTAGLAYIAIPTISASDAEAYQYALEPPRVLTLIGLVSGSDIVILNAGTETERVNVDANSGTTYGYSYPYVAGSYVDICVYKAGCVPFAIRSYLLSDGDVSLPVAQVPDRNYTP